MYLFLSFFATMFYMADKTKKTNQILSRGVEDIVVKKDLERLLNSGKKLRVYYGIDPTSTKIHLGHAVPLRKLREFAEAGHKTILLIGSFTAQIGDPTDRDAARVPLSQKEIEENFQTYKKQASKILDFSKTKVVYNADWLSKLSFGDVVRLAQKFTVQQMLERDMYQKRLKEGKPIGLHEFFYPLMQGYDSVELEVDLEIGGTDQLFNMLAGRLLLKEYKNKDKHVLTAPLLEGLDGRKMSKTFGNTVNISDDPDDMFGKIMSLRDDLIIKYFELCTDISDAEIHDLKEGLKSGDNPRNAKAYLAREIVKIYHGEQFAQRAENAFDNVFVKGGKPEAIKQVKIKKGVYQADELLFELGVVASKSEAKRVIEQAGAKMDDKIIKDWKQKIKVKDGMVVQVGKRKFVKIQIV